MDSVVPRVKMTSRVDAALTKRAHALARVLEHPGGFLAQLVHAAVHVRVVQRFVGVDRVDDARGRCDEAALSRNTSGLP